MLKNKSNTVETEEQNTFISGVVEGFYGKPWSKVQRKHLFSRLQELGFNTYFYAPKDDVKHRGQWRELYTQDETDILSELITDATNQQVDFVYALSPGIDIHYSDIKEIELIEKKFAQVKSLGCKSFALLFDDIETEMHSEDREKFPSFAAAQVAVTNEVFEHLGCPKFYFCPTEYCETRAVPSITDSEYLRIIGNSLMRKIFILWTGPQVISQYLTEEHMTYVASVLKRKPLIWDNLHANDYDPKRVFLGPFAGRSVQLKQSTAGILLNPNCKFEANFIPLFTFSQWNKSEGDAAEFTDRNTIMEASDVTTYAINPAESSNLYHPLNSLCEAIQEWVSEFNKVKNLIFTDPSNDLKLADVEMASPKVLTELVEAVVNLDDNTAEMNSLKPDFEQMETSNVLNDNVIAEENSKKHSREEQMDSEEAAIETTEPSITYEQLATFVDLFFLPFDNGRRAEEILENFVWMYENSWLMNDRGLPEEEQEGTYKKWMARYNTVYGYVQSIKAVFNYIGECPNRLIVADLIPYIWEIHGTVSVILGVLSWLRLGIISTAPDAQSRFWKNCVKDEPWVSSGGFCNQIYKVICGEGDLLEFCTGKTMLPLSIVDFTIVPLKSGEINRFSCMATAEEDRTYEQNQLNVLLFMDKYVKFFIEHDNRFAFLTTDDGIVGYPNAVCSAIAVLNAKTLLPKLPEYINNLQEKYTNFKCEGVYLPSIVSEISRWFPIVPEFIVDCFPSWVDVRFSATAYDAIPTKRMIHAIAVSLSIAGSNGMFVTVPFEETNKITFFKTIGFVEITQSEDMNHAVLARSISRIVEDPIDTK